MVFFHLGAIFDASEGNGLTFTATFPWLECLIVLWVFFSLLPPASSLSSVIFCQTPHTPWLDDVIYEQPLTGWLNWPIVGIQVQWSIYDIVLLISPGKPIIKVFTTFLVSDSVITKHALHTKISVDIPPNISNSLNRLIPEDKQRQWYLETWPRHSWTWITWSLSWGRS